MENSDVILTDEMKICALLCYLHRELSHIVKRAFSHIYNSNKLELWYSAQRTCSGLKQATWRKGAFRVPHLLYSCNSTSAQRCVPPISTRPGWVALSPLLTFPMTSAGGIDGEADILANMKIYLFPFFLPFLRPSLPPSSCCSSFFDTWGGFNLSSCWNLADWLVGGLSRPYLVCAVHECLCMCLCVCMCILPTPQFLRTGGGLCVW